VKTIHEILFRTIKDLDVISENLKTLGKNMEASIPQFAVEEYYRILLAAERLRESIEFLREIAAKTNSVISMT
jgi:hypothetical protein